MIDDAHILIADDEDASREWLSGTLRHAGFAVSSVATGEDAIARLIDRRRRPDLLVLDLDLPDVSGFTVLERAQGSADPETVPTIIVSGWSDVDHKVTALEAGAVDFLSKPLDGRELVARVRTHLRVSSLATQWRQGADLDPLTGLLNRRGFLGRLGREVERVAHAGAPLAVLFIDLDNFKEVNDRFGHAAGDRALLRVADVLAAQLGAGALLGRWGGDEFVAAIAETADRVQELAGDLQVALPLIVGATTVGASVGVAWLRPHEIDAAATDHLPMALIEAADRAMYDDKATRSGVHRTVGTTSEGPR